MIWLKKLKEYGDYQEISSLNVLVNTHVLRMYRLVGIYIITFHFGLNSWKVTTVKYCK